MRSRVPQIWQDKSCKPSLLTSGSNSKHHLQAPYLAFIFSQDCSLTSLAHSLAKSVDKSTSLYAKNGKPLHAHFILDCFRGSQAHE